MSEGYDDRLPAAVDAALDRWLRRWADRRLLDGARAEEMYRAIVSTEPDLSARWYRDLLRHTNQAASQATRASAGLVALVASTVRARPSFPSADVIWSRRGTTGYRPYLRLVPGFPPGPATVGPT